MTQSQLISAKLLKEQIDVVSQEIATFSPTNYCTCLQLQDMYGNKGSILRLYGHSHNESISLGNTTSKILSLYKKFLEESQKILISRKEELEKAFAKI